MHRLGIWRLANFLSRHLRLLAALGLAAGVGVLALALRPDPDRDAALAAYEALQPGMTFEDAGRVMTGELEPAPYPAGPVCWHFGYRYRVGATFYPPGGPFVFNPLATFPYWFNRTPSGPRVLAAKDIEQSWVDWSDFRGMWNALWTGELPWRSRILRQWVSPPITRRGGANGARRRRFTRTSEAAGVRLPPRPTVRWLCQSMVPQ